MHGKLLFYLIVLIVIYLSTYVRAQRENPYYRHRLTTFPPFDRMDNIRKLNLKVKLKGQDVEVNSRKDPDSLFFGFFPIWSAILVGLTGFCLFVTLIGVLCHLAGCLSPKRKYRKNKKLINPYYSTCDNSIYMPPPSQYPDPGYLPPLPAIPQPYISNPLQQSLLPDPELNSTKVDLLDETSTKMNETNFDKQSSRIYNESRRSASEYSFEKKLYQHAKKKRFMKNNL